MKQMIDKTVIQTIQSQCDSLHIALKHKKEEKHMTNQDVADITGVPVSNVAKFFSGILARPDVFNVMAICICLNASLDELLGNGAAAKTDDNRIKELEAENERLKKDLHHAEKMEAIREKESDRIDRILKIRNNFVYILIALSSFMVLTILGYLRIDANNPEAGYLRHDGASPWIALVVLVMVATVGVAVAFGIKKIKNLRKKGDTNE